MRTFLKCTTAVVIALLLTCINLLAHPSDSAGERITLRVDGLSCPFCAYGLEKKLKSLKGVSNLNIKVNDGVVTLDVKSGVKLTEDHLKKAVKDAGFTLRNIKRESLTASTKVEKTKSKDLHDGKR